MWREHAKRKKEKGKWKKISVDAFNSLPYCCPLRRRWVAHSYLYQVISWVYPTPFWGRWCARKYNLYESPIQRSRNVMKAGLMPASSKSMRAQTRPECNDIPLNSSADQSEWTFFAIDQSTSAILPPVRYFLMPNLLTNMPIGSESDWSSFLALRWMRWAARTGHMSW